MDDERSRTPLLQTNLKNQTRSTRNSVNALKCDFLSKLPDKVKTGLDPEASSHLDFSKTTGLAAGKTCTLFILGVCMNFSVTSFGLSQTTHNISYLI